MALDGIFPEEAVGKRINRVIDDELTPLRNRIAHTFLESGEPGLFVDDVLYVDMAIKWLPLAKCFARQFLKEEFPDIFQTTVDVQRV